MELPFSESFRIKMVETIRKSTREEREQWIKEAKYNLFNLKSDRIHRSADRFGYRGYER